MMKAVRSNSRTAFSIHLFSLRQRLFLTNTFVVAAPVLMKYIPDGNTTSIRSPCYRNQLGRAFMLKSFQ